MRRLMCVFCLCLLAALPASASDQLTFGRLSVSRLEAVFDFYGYNGEKGYLMIPGYRYPPIFLRYFPDDFNKITDEKRRNALFIKILAPLALHINNEILTERRQIRELNENFRCTGELTAEQEKLVEKKAAKYDVFTRFQGHRRYSYLLSELLNRVHVVPPSILITAAALETNWGTSRIVREGNSLYKTLVWHTAEGLKPIGETEDDTYRIKTYPDIGASMREFALKLNSGLPYADFRGFRNRILERRTPLLGSVLAPYLVWNSPLKNYAGLFDYTLAYYELNIIDKSVLDSKMISRELPENLRKLAL